MSDLEKARCDRDDTEERLSVDPPKEFTGLAGVVKWAEDMAKADPPESLPEMTVSAILRHHTFVHDRGDPARWEQVIDMVYRDRRAMMIRGPQCMPTAVMINRDERKHCIAWISRSHAGLGGYYQHGMTAPEPGGDDRLFGMPVFWAAPGSMNGQTVRVLTDFTQR